MSRLQAVIDYEIGNQLIYCNLTIIFRELNKTPNIFYPVLTVVAARKCCHLPVGTAGWVIFFFFTGILNRSNGHSRFAIYAI